MEFSIFIIFSLFLVGFDCAKIMAVHPTISRSHMIPLQTLAIALAEKGHEITFFSSFPLSKKKENYRDFEVPLEEADKEFVAEMVKNPNSNGSIAMFSKAISIFFRVTNQTLQSSDMKRLMKEEQFDLLIIGFSFTEAITGLADHFKCPTIVLNPIEPMGSLNEALGNPLGASGTPQMVVPIGEMNFIYRLKDFLVSIGGLALTQYMKYQSRQVYEFNFPPDRYRSFENSLKNISLVMVNNHFSSGNPRPLLPNLVEVGGIQVKPKASPLPERLKKFLDGAKDGAVLFSLGSNAKSTYLSKETVSTLLKVFSSLKQRVVMKWEADTLDGKPDNVFISKWLPQDDVLAHPNIKLFISHCGIGGAVEAKYHAVPIVGLPIFGDQHDNAANIEQEGWAIILDLETITEETLTNAVNEVLSDPKYYNRVKRLSDLTRDRPMNAQDTAIYWVEYVLRYNGAPHMHYPGADFNFLQYNSIDVIAFLVAVTYAFVKIIALLAKKICCRKRQKAHKQKTIKKPIDTTCWLIND